MYQSLTWNNRKFRTFDEELKVDIKKKNLNEERRKFLDYLLNNQDIVFDLSNDQLIKVLEYSELENDRKRKLLNGFYN